MANTGFLIQTKKKKEVLPSEYTTMGDFPAVGQQYVYYKALDTGIFYKWDGDSYEVINPAMDVNNQFTSVSGLPQATMDNPLDSPTYRVLNTTACPVDPSEEVNLIVEGSFDDANMQFELYGTLSSSLSTNIDVTFAFTYKENGIGASGGSHLLSINSGEILGSTIIPYPAIGTITDIAATVTLVNPNPSGTKTIIY